MQGSRGELANDARLSSASLNRLQICCDWEAPQLAAHLLHNLLAHKFNLFIVKVEPLLVPVSV